MSSLSLITLLTLTADVPAADVPAAEAVVPSAGLPSLAGEALPRVVKIFGAGGFRGLPAYSTGCLVSPDGHIATIWNHVLDTDRITVVLDDGRRLEAELLGADPDLDIAVLKVEASGLPFFDVADPPRVQPGQRVLCLSNMYKVATGDEPVSVQVGTVAAVTDLSARRGRNPIPLDGEAIIVDAVTGVSGAGGGAVVDLQGRLVGMLGREVKGQLTNAWINYAAPTTRLAPVIGRIVDGTFVIPEDEDTPPLSAGQPSRLGVVTVPNVVPRTPAFIDEVVAGGEAERAGLQPDDLIVSVDGQLVPSIAALEELLATIEADVPVDLVVRRGRELVAVRLRIAE